ncbi:MAG: class I SAM-dependent methyltransferase [Hyphomonadaceae bacterium JAD_PAG50586_4]|nr:MAG: class I SAM-dependent methyltransferase [Hyphomonadaceae bacterium JAD_PAG50586_4]
MDPRRQSPSVARNRAPILAVLQRILAPDAHVLELASGTGEHAVFFSETLPGVIWQTSDPDPDARDTIAAWIRSEGVANVLAPREIDVSAAEWDVAGPFDAMVAINLIHISPWQATLGLMAGAGRLLRSGGVLFTYGAYKRGGAHTAPSNESFDQWLKQRDPRFGVRDLEAVEAAAKAEALTLGEIIEMPANNFALVFER